MAPEMGASLLRLSAGERADLAMALWESLDESDPEAAVDLTPTQAVEFERRLAERCADRTLSVSREDRGRPCAA